MKIYTGVLQINKIINDEYSTSDNVYIHTSKDESALASLILTELFDYFDTDFREGIRQDLRKKCTTLEALALFINILNKKINQHKRDTVCATMYYYHEIKFHFKMVEIEESDKDDKDKSESS